MNKKNQHDAETCKIIQSIYNTDNVIFNYLIIISTSNKLINWFLEMGNLTSFKRQQYT